MVRFHTLTPKVIFVDSSAYFSLIRAKDHNHQQALLIARHLDLQQWRIFTTSFVVAETHALIVNRLRRSDLGLVFLTTMNESKGTTVIQPTMPDQQRALQILGQHRDKQFSYADATSFAVMERFGISQVFSFDREFAQYGWSILSAELLSPR